MSAFSLSQRDQKENKILGHSDHIFAPHKVSSFSYAKPLLHFFFKSNMYLHLAAKSLLHDNPVLIWERCIYEIQIQTCPVGGRNAV